MFGYMEARSVCFVYPPFLVMRFRVLSLGDLGAEVKARERSSLLFSDGEDDVVTRSASDGVSKRQVRNVVATEKPGGLESTA